MFFEADVQKEAFIAQGFDAEALARGVNVVGDSFIYAVTDDEPSTIMVDGFEFVSEDGVDFHRPVEVPYAVSANSVLVRNSPGGMAVVPKSRLADEGYNFGTIEVGATCVLTEGGTRLVGAGAMGELLVYDTMKREMVEVGEVMTTLHFANSDGVPVYRFSGNYAYDLGALMRREDLDFNPVGFYDALCNGLGRAAADRGGEGSQGLFLLRNVIVAAKGELPEVDASLKLDPTAWDRVRDNLNNQEALLHLGSGQSLGNFFGRMPKSMVDTARRGFALHTRTPMDDIRMSYVDKNMIHDATSFFDVFYDGEQIDVNREFISGIEESLSNPAVGMNYTVEVSAMVKYGDLEILYIKDQGSNTLYFSVNAMDSELLPKDNVVDFPALGAA